jgi:hypothetical protein
VDEASSGIEGGGKKIWQPDSGKSFSTSARILHREGAGVTHFIPGVLFILADKAQPIPKMLFMVSANVS